MKPAGLFLLCVFAASMDAQGLDLTARSGAQRAAPSLFATPRLDSVAQAAGLDDDAFQLGHFSFGVSAGLMLDPVGFGANIEGDAWLLPFFAVGTRLSLGVGGDTFVLGLAPVVKGIAPLPLYERTLLYAFVGPGLA